MDLSSINLHACTGDTCYCRPGNTAHVWTDAEKEELKPRRRRRILMNPERFASRKFLLACAAFLAGVAFFSLGMLTAAQWLSHTTWVLGLYMAGNVADTAVTPKEKS